MSYKGSVDKCILLVSGMSLLGKLHLICGNLFNQNITFHFMLLLRPKLSESKILLNFSNSFDMVPIVVLGA